MTACRARMCDGTPVTFDWIDQGGIKYRRDGDAGVQSCALYVSEMIGEGFYVRSVSPNYSRHTAISRLEEDRIALEDCGVDTATVERKNEPGPPPWLPWVPVFPNKHEDAGTSYFLEAMSMPPPKSWYTGLVTEAMLAAGAAAMKDMIKWEGCVIEGAFWFRSPDVVLTAIYRAMEKARK